MSDVTATRYIRLADHPWLDGLRGPGSVWEGAPSKQVILVVATANEQEWAAYYQLPHQGNEDAVAVANHGNKLPEQVARDLFGHFPQRYRW